MIYPPGALCVSLLPALMNDGEMPRQTRLRGERQRWKASFRFSAQLLGFFGDESLSQTRAGATSVYLHGDLFPLSSLAQHIILTEQTGLASIQNSFFVVMPISIAWFRYRFYYVTFSDIRCLKGPVCKIWPDLRFLSW